jgi:hypothetical protein
LVGHQGADSTRNSVGMENAVRDDCGEDDDDDCA